MVRPDTGSRTAGEGRSLNEPASLQALTDHQLEVIRLVARGLPNKEVAATLRVSERAVEATLTRIYDKLDVANRSALIALALSEGGFGLSVARRRAPSEVGALTTPRSLEEETSVYANAPFMVAVTQGPEHRFTFVNRVAAEVAGRGADSIVGKTVLGAYPDLDPQFGAALDQAYATGRPWTTGVPVAVRWTHADGTVRESHVNLIFQPVRDASGGVVGLLHIGAEAASDRT